MKRIVLAVTALLIATSAFAQTESKTTAPRFYKLDFVLKELEAGKLVSSRTYVMNITNNERYNSGSVRTGDKVPTPTNKEGSFTYLDVGVNIDCRDFKLFDDQVFMQVVADISSIANQGNPPVLVQTKWSSSAIFPLRKTTMLFSADGASSKRQMQLEVTATPIP